MMMTDHEMQVKLADMIVNNASSEEIAKAAFDDIYPEHKNRKATLTRFEQITYNYYDSIRYDIHEIVDDFSFIGSEQVDQINRLKSFIQKMDDAYFELGQNFEKILAESLDNDDDVFEMFENIL